MIILDAIHGCIGAANVNEVRTTEAWRNDAETYDIR